MKKYTFLVYHRQYAEFLEQLKAAGVLHVIEKSDAFADNDTLRRKMQAAARIRTMLRRLDALRPSKAEPLPAPATIDLDLPDTIDALLKEKEALHQQLALVEKERERMDAWGEFDTQRIEQLEKMGYRLTFFSTPLRKFKQEWEVAYNAFEINRLGSQLYFVTVTRPGETIDIDAERVALGDRTASELDTDIRQLHDDIERVNRQLSDHSVNSYQALKEIEADVLTGVAHERVLLSTRREADERVMLLEGWCPDDAEAELNAMLEAANVYYETAEPTADEAPPIKFRNNPFARMFEFITELYDMPSYHERDLTAWFAPFYVLFFGLCLGDVGYGLLLFIAGLWMRSRAKEPAIKQVMGLLSVLGIGAMVMGTISATFFGIGLLNVDWPWIQGLKRFMLTTDQLFYNALILGVVQILFGMVLKWTGEIRRGGFMASLSTMGWLILFLGSIVAQGLAYTNVIDAKTAEQITIGVAAVGGVCIFLLNNIKRNPLINIGAGLWDTYNMATGLLGDVLSYIRLFALGLSGGVMGFVFNNLAANIGESVGVPVVSQLVTALILVFGHSINIFIAVLGAMVHPMRLTFVEFYKNAGFEGGGKKYRPFAKYKEEKPVI